MAENMYKTRSDLKHVSVYSRRKRERERDREGEGEEKREGEREERERKIKKHMQIDKAFRT